MYRKLVPALIAPLIVASACASEADDAAVEVRNDPAAAIALRAAPDLAAEAGTAAFEVVVEVSDGGEAFEMVATGAYDSPAQRMTMEMDMGAMFEQLAAATGETIPAGLDEPIRIVADGSTVYVQGPMLAMVGGTTDWLAFSADDLGTSAGDLGLGAGAYDPSKILESLRGVTGEPEVIGTEEVRGVKTTRYTATMDLARAVAEAPADQRAALEAQLEQLGGSGIVVDVWVDDDGLPRRMRMDLSESPAGMTDEAARAVMTMEYFDYGVPVDIQVPSPDEVQSLTDVMGGLDDALGLAS